jgi:hypothetical protein
LEDKLPERKRKASALLAERRFAYLRLRDSAAYAHHAVCSGMELFKNALYH